MIDTVDGYSGSAPAPAIETNVHPVRVWFSQPERWQSLVGFTSLPPAAWNDPWLALYGDREQSVDPIWLRGDSIVAVEGLSDAYTTHDASKRTGTELLLDGRT